jgi:hypothetical protein
LSSKSTVSKLVSFEQLRSSLYNSNNNNNVDNNVDVSLLSQTQQEQTELVTSNAKSTAKATAAIEFKKNVALLSFGWMILSSTLVSVPVITMFPESTLAATATTTTSSTTTTLTAKPKTVTSTSTATAPVIIEPFKKKAVTTAKLSLDNASTKLLQVTKDSSVAKNTVEKTSASIVRAESTAKSTRKSYLDNNDKLLKMKSDRTIKESTVIVQQKIIGM